MNKKQYEDRIKELESELSILKLSVSPLTLTNIETGKFTTELIKTKEKSEENEKKFRRLFENSPIGISMTGIDNSLDVNNTFCKILGYTREELKGKNFLEMTHPEDWQKSKDMIQSLLKGDSQQVYFEKRYIHKNGNIVWTDLSSYLQRDKDNNPQFFITTIIDTTARKLAEKKLIRSEHELQKAQQITHIGSWYLDVATNELIWTEELYKMYGFDPTLPPPPYTEQMKLFTPESREILTASLSNTSETGAPYEHELQIVRKDGTKGWMWVRGEAQKDSEGNIVSLWGAVQDISDHREREQRLVEALERAKESDRLKSAFLANMSHEIRTPMNGILGFAELLKEPNLTHEVQQDFISTIWKSGKRMLNTINNIVDVSKIESGLMNINLHETNINDRVDFAYKFFKPEVEAKGLKFSCKKSLPENRAIIKTDDEKVFSLLTNLIKNAIKFTEKGSIEFGYSVKGEYLEFFVKDSGSGIPENQREIIFERFRQGSEDFDRKYEGSGLGLSICKSYAEMLGGKLWLESNEGGGSIFYFIIPLIVVENENLMLNGYNLEENKSNQTKNLKILIAEDDETSYTLLSLHLNNISTNILRSVTGIEAIEVCERNNDIDLIMMDIRMPKMDGFEATRQIRKFNKEVIIIAQTAHAFSEDKKRASEAGCNDYISKPINRNHLKGLIDKYFGTNSGT